MLSKRFVHAGTNNATILMRMVFGLQSWLKRMTEWISTTNLHEVESYTIRKLFKELTRLMPLRVT